MSNYHSIPFPSSKISPKISSLLQEKPMNTTSVNRITFQRIIPTNQSIYSSSSKSSCHQQPIEDLPPKLQEIIRLFQSVQDQSTKHKQLFFYGKNSKPLDAKYKTIDNKVQSSNCLSQIWVRAYFDNDKNVIFEADSDTEIYKGLSALLVQGLSGRPVEEIIRVSPDFAVFIGLPSSRYSGFFDTLELMKKKALQLYVESEKSGNEQLGKESSGPVMECEEGHSLVVVDES